MTKSHHQEEKMEETLHHSPHHLASGLDKDKASGDGLRVDQGSDNLQELTNIFREVLSDGSSKEVVEPHPKEPHPKEPHPKEPHPKEPHPNVNKQNKDENVAMQVKKQTSEPENMASKREATNQPAPSSAHHSEEDKATPAVLEEDNHDDIPSLQGHHDDIPSLQGHHDDIPSLQGHHASLHRWGSMEGLNQMKEGSDVIGGGDDVIGGGDDVIGGGDDAADGASVASDDTFVVRDDVAQGSLTTISERKLSSEIHRRVTQLEDNKPEGAPLTKNPAGGEVVINGNVSHMLRVFRGADKPGEEAKQRNENASNEGRKEAEFEAKVGEDTTEHGALVPGALVRVHSLEAIAESDDEEEGGRMQGAEPGDTKPQPSTTSSSNVALQNKESPNKLKKAPMVSPLTISKDASNLKREISKLAAPPTAPLLPSQGLDSSLLYMTPANLPHLNNLTPANLPHLNNLLEEHRGRMVAMAQEAVKRLTKEPMSSRKIPHVFRGIRQQQHEEEQLHVWKQKVDIFLYP